MQHYQRYAAKIGRTPFTDEECAATQRAEKIVKERWGNGLGGENGLALPLFPGKDRVPFVDLEKLAGLDHLRPFYRLGSLTFTRVNERRN